MRPFFLLILTLFIAWAPEWSPYYVGFLSQGELEVMGTLQSKGVPCDQRDQGEMQCRNAYRIPHAELGDKASVGLGILISSTQVRCENAESGRIILGDPKSPSRALELQKTYQTIDLENLRCQGDLLIDAWSPRSFRRSGYIGTPWVRGSSGAVMQVKRVVQFFSAEFYLLLSLFLLLCFLVQSLILKPVLIAKAQGSSWRKFAGLWVAFAVMKSGIFEILFPVVSTSLVFIRVSNWISLLAHSSPILWVLSGSFRGAWGRSFFAGLNKKRDLWWSSPWSMILAVICLSGAYGWALSAIGLALIPLYFGLGFRHRKFDLVVFSIPLGLECLKLFNYTGLPLGSMTLIFVSGILLTEFWGDLKEAASIAGVLQWWRRLGGDRSSLQASVLIRSYAQQFGIKRISLLIPHQTGECTIVQQSHQAVGESSKSSEWSVSELYLESIPPVFSHVLTTSQGLWNLDERSEQAFNLKKGQSRDSETSSKGHLFSVLPVRRGAQVLGALGITQYDDSEKSPLSARELAEFAFHILEPSLAQALHVHGIQAADEWYRKCSSLSSDLGRPDNGAPTAMELSMWMQDVAQRISNALGVSVLFARVHPGTRLLDEKVVSGFSGDVGQVYLDTDLYALAGNLQGPMPMAVNQNRVVTVSDLNWLKAVLHPKSLELFSRSEARSGAAIPIQWGEKGFDVWGVLWLESKQRGFFHSDALSGLEILADSLSLGLSKVLLSHRAHQVLSGLSRPDVAAKLLKGESVAERETGILAMVDVRGSTVLANRYGAEAWKKFMIAIEPDFVRLISPFGFTLQRVVWDAFFLTKAVDKPQSGDVHEALKMGLQLDELFTAALVSAFPEEMNRRSTRSIRVCLEFGDISRDLLNGVWTILGVAMACVHKLEAVCKGISGWFFVSGVFAPLDRNRFDQTHARHPSTGVEIWSESYYLDTRKLDPHAAPER